MNQSKYIFIYHLFITWDVTKTSRHLVSLSDIFPGTILCIYWKNSQYGHRVHFYASKKQKQKVTQKQKQNKQQKYQQNKTKQNKNKKISCEACVVHPKTIPSALMTWVTERCYFVIQVT